MHGFAMSKEQDLIRQKGSERVREILSWYRGENSGVLRNLYCMLSAGRLAGTGKMVILPVDQGFEHGPTRSFAKNDLGYDPDYHFQLAIEAGCNAYAAPYGQVVASHHKFAGHIPVILKVNNNDSLFPSKNPVPAITCSVKEALRVGATAIGFTIYPGSSYRKEMYEEVRELSEEARSYGLPTVIWSYPRGEAISKEGETAIDVVAYAAHIAAQLGAHIIKVKPPSESVELKSDKKVIDLESLAIGSLEERVRLVVKSVFNGKRITIFSGGDARSDEEVLSEVRSIHNGGGFGSIIGRNSFQRKKEDGIKLLTSIMNIYAGKGA